MYAGEIVQKHLNKTLKSHVKEPWNWGNLGVSQVIVFKATFIHSHNRIASSVSDVR